MFCRNCGKELPNGVVMCGYCGTPIAGVDMDMQQENKNKNSTSVLLNAWLNVLIVSTVGILGIHKFLEKKIGMGLLYLFTLGLGGIGYLVDVIKSLSNAIRITVDSFSKK